MKHINILLNFFIFCTLFICLGCSESDTNLQIELVILDSEGNETNELHDPDNFSLAIKAMNNSNEEIQFFFNDCLLAQQDKDFLMVYENDNEKKPVGRPFPDEVYCPMPNDRPFIIAPNSTSLILR